MPNWNSLAPEVHDIILSFVCQNIIDQYTPVCLQDINEVQNKLIRLDRPVWSSKSPSSLRDFVAVLVSCRSFYYSVKRIIIDGESPIARLQSIQDDKCVVIHQILTGEGLTHTSPPAVMKIYTITTLVGFFWKNPLVLKKPDTIMKVLDLLDEESLIMFIPHLEEWVLQHVAPMQKDQEFRVLQRKPSRFNEMFGLGGVVVLQVGSWVGPICDSGSVMSIRGLYEGSEFVRQEVSVLSPATASVNAIIQQEINHYTVKNCPVFRHLDRRSQVEWSLFKLLHSRLEPWWIVVDYSGRRIWGNFCAPTEMCVWEDIWDPESWKFGLDNAFSPDRKIFGLD
jgi:hypothetical protein